MASKCAALSSATEDWISIKEAQERLVLTRDGVTYLIRKGKLVGERGPDGMKWERVTLESVLTHINGNGPPPNVCPRCWIESEGLCAMCMWELNNPGRHIYYPTDVLPSTWMHRTSTPS